MATVDKFNYLHSLQEKTASEAIEGLVLTNANLKTIFDNKQMIVNKHMDDLINMAPVFCSYDLRGLT